MSTINFGTRLTLAQAANLIAAVGHKNRIALLGEKGIGKSTIMNTLRERFGDAYEYGYIDCGRLELGDTAIPFPNRDLRVVEYFTNREFGLHTGKPVIIMLDEFAKATRSVQNMLHPLLEVTRPRLGDIPLPAGSIVFITSNLSDEGLGDQLLGHTLDRLTVVEVAKPNASQWAVWATDAGCHPALIACVDENPHVLASFRDPDFDQDNPFPYNPKRVQSGKHVSNRGLELTSNLLHVRDSLDEETFVAAVIGTVGEPMGRLLDEFVTYYDQLPTREAILNTPEQALVPRSGGAAVTLIHKLVAMSEKDNFSNIMKYVQRLEPEHQAVFCITMARAVSKRSFAMTNAAFTKWCMENQDIVAN